MDLNTAIAPGSGFQLTNAFNVNDRGEILAKAAPLGFTPNDDADLGHLVLLVPCDPEEEDCSARLQGAHPNVARLFSILGELGKGRRDNLPRQRSLVAEIHEARIEALRVLAPRDRPFQESWPVEVLLGPPGTRNVKLSEPPTPLPPAQVGK